MNSGMVDDVQLMMLPLCMHVSTRQNLRNMGRKCDPPTLLETWIPSARLS